MSKIKLGVSLYCFTKEYISGEYSLEDCIRRCAELGVDGFEIVGSQMVPSYPYISDDFLGKINSYAAEYGVRAISYGANTDRGMRHDRDLNEQELLHSTIRDIKSAHKLGCKVMRAQYLLSPKVMGLIAPYPCTISNLVFPPHPSVRQQDKHISPRDTLTYGSAICVPPHGHPKRRTHRPHCGRRREDPATDLHSDR